MGTIRGCTKEMTTKNIDNTIVINGLKQITDYPYIIGDY
jgi:hypothetical protein